VGECSVLSLLYTWVGWDDGGVGPVIERWESDPSKEESNWECVAHWLAEMVGSLLHLQFPMDIKSLLHLGCAKVASLIKGQPLEKIKDILSTGKKDEKKDN